RDAISRENDGICLQVVTDFFDRPILEERFQRGEHASEVHGGSLDRSRGIEKVCLTVRWIRRWSASFVRSTMAQGNVAGDARLRGKGETDDRGPECRRSAGQHAHSKTAGTTEVRCQRVDL